MIQRVLDGERQLPDGTEIVPRALGARAGAEEGSASSISAEGLAQRAPIHIMHNLSWAVAKR
ncbi:MAG: hypothetical protein AB1713_01255 [Pseudomonadota bacterium]